jgi:hypothetical protein
VLAPEIPFGWRSLWQGAHRRKWALLFQEEMGGGLDAHTNLDKVAVYGIAGYGDLTAIRVHEGLILHSHGTAWFDEVEVIREAR